MAFAKIRHSVVFIIIIMASASISHVSAAPAPGTVEGSPQDGAEIVIRGSGFGEKSQPAPILFDTQDEVWINGVMTTPYSNLSHGESFPTGGNNPWLSGGTGVLRYWDNGGYPRYGGVFPQDQGEAEYKRAWIANPNGFPDPATGEVKEVYIRWWFKMSASVSVGGGASNKFLRVWDTNGPSGENSFGGGGIFWDQKKLYPIDTNSGSSWIQTSPVVGQWNLMEFYLRTSPSPYMAAWLNGERIHHIPDYSPPAGVRGLRPRLWGMDGSGPADFTGATIELSDYYADSSRARVEIGNSSQWNNVTIREPQLPIDWAGSEIRIRVHQGRLQSIASGYIYVIDADGNVNQTGLPLDDVAPPAQMPIPSVQ